MLHTPVFCMKLGQLRQGINMPTDEDIEDQLELACEQLEDGTRWPGMSYEDGVDAALRWVLGYTDDKPMDD